MELLDPRLAAIAGVGAAVVGSERVRRTIGRGVGYAASGVATVAAPVVRPVVGAGRDIVEEARSTASHDGARANRAKAGGSTAQRTTPRSRSRSRRPASSK
jgi:hypothetical protein